MPKTYFIKTYGCQMNMADSEHLAGVLESSGYRKAETEKDADIILVNTCVVRQHAEDRALGYIASLKGVKTRNPDLIIGVCGCIAREEHIDLKAKFPFVDLVFGPNEPEKLREFLGSEKVESRKVKVGSKIRGEGFVTIMHGCNNFCSYCVVPYVRGPEVSRLIPEVIAEINQLANKGITSITLLGQNVNSYKYSLANLLRTIGNKNGLKINFLTSHPRDMSDDIIEAVYELPYVAREFLIPLQSGDNDILKKMNRGYTLEHYLGRVDKIRSLMPEARITTDILVGFPGETEEQFKNTLQAVEQIRFNEVHMFAYSVRPQTAAAKMAGHLPDEIKQERLQRLIELVRQVVR